MIPSFLRSRKSRRGISAVEFALVTPAMLAMVLGLMDYGWFFSQQSQAVSALAASVRAGTNITPDIGAPAGTCDECIDTAANHAMFSLRELGISVQKDAVTPAIERIEGTCALVLSTSIPHEPIVDLVPVPGSYRVDVAYMLLNVNDC